MTFEEILPFLKLGKMACFEKSSHYLFIHNEQLVFFRKDNDYRYCAFEGSVECLRDDWMIYEPEQEKCIKEKKLVDFSVNWYPTLESMNRNEKDFIEDGWETFKKESLDYNTDVMTHKLMMVKYE